MLIFHWPHFMKATLHWCRVRSGVFRVYWVPAHPTEIKGMPPGTTNVSLQDYRILAQIRKSTEFFLSGT
jgi:hypothetical protein